MTGLEGTAFVFFFLGDLNDWKFHRKELSWFFACGAVLLASSVILSLSLKNSIIQSWWLRIPVWILSAGCFGMLIKCLFFSFPAKDAYIEPGKKRAVCREGQYAVCRHPGFWWLLLGLTGLSLSAGYPFSSLVLCTACNFLLVLFEDRWVFPSVLSGYEPYQREVPFLLPAVYHRGAHEKQEMGDR